MTPTHRAFIAAFAVLLTLLSLPAVAAPVPEARNITTHFTDAGFAVDRLQAFEVGGIVVLRGRTYERSAAEAAGLYAQALGHTRVANLIQVLEPPNDAIIQRAAERELALHRALEGTRLSVESEKGIVMLRGRVQHAAQTEMAISVLRLVDGVREVRTQVERE